MQACAARVAQCAVANAAAPHPPQHWQAPVFWWHVLTDTVRPTKPVEDACAPAAKKYSGLPLHEDLQKLLVQN
jgi:hypothetical protein